MATKKINFNGVVDDIGADAQNVDYTNTNQQDVSNVKEALDKVFQGGLVEKNLTSRNIFNGAGSAMIDNTTYGGDPSKDLWIDTSGAVVQSAATGPGGGCHIIGVPVDGGQTYCYRLSNHDRCDKARTSYSGIHCYDSNGTYIKKVEQYPCCEGGYMFTVPDNCALIKFVTKFYQTNYESMLRTEFMLERGSVVHDYEPYNAKYLAGVNGNKIGAQHPDEPDMFLPYNIAILGDSISNAPTAYWHQFLQEKYAVKNLIDLGVGGGFYRHTSGTTFTTDAGIRLVSNQANRLVAIVNGQISGMSFPKPDIVIIHAGRNDGEVADNYAPSTGASDADYLAAINNMENMYAAYGNPSLVFRYDKYPHSGTTSVSGGTPYFEDNNGVPIMNKSIHCSVAGGIRYVVELLKTAFPDVKVVLTTPLYETAGLSTWRHRWCNRIIKECASFLSVPVIDLTYEINFNTLDNGRYLLDGLHPSMSGSRRMADFIGHKLMLWYGRSQKDYDTRWYPINGTIYKIDGETPFANQEFTIIRSDGKQMSMFIITDSSGNFEGFWKDTGNNSAPRARTHESATSIPAGWYILRGPNSKDYVLGEVKGAMNNIEIVWPYNV